MKANKKKMLWYVAGAAGAIGIIYMVVQSTKAKQKKLLLENIAAGLKAMNWSDANIAKVITGASALNESDFAVFATYLLNYHFPGKVPPNQLTDGMNAILNRSNWWPK